MAISIRDAIPDLFMGDGLAIAGMGECLSLVQIKRKKG
jgi:hypothetical protein